MIKIGIVEDDKTTREGLETILNLLIENPIIITDPIPMSWNP